MQNWHQLHLLPALKSECPVIVISDCESEVVVEYSQKVDPSPVFGMQVIVPDSESESEQDVKPSQDLLASVNNLERKNPETGTGCSPSRYPRYS